MARMLLRIAVSLASCHAPSLFRVRPMTSAVSCAELAYGNQSERNLLPAAVLLAVDAACEMVKSGEPLSTSSASTSHEKSSPPSPSDFLVMVASIWSDISEMELSTKAGSYVRFW